MASPNTGFSFRKQTGEVCTISGTYRFDGYTDGTSFPPPTANEQQIPMDLREVFPPVKSSKKAAWWKWERS